MNNRLVRALLRQPVDRTPVWIMRQAGRYLPEYRALRKRVPDFLTFCQTPELSAQATLQPVERFDLDAAIIFSDILVIPAAMGLELQFVPGDGPCFVAPLRTPRDLNRLHLPDVEQDLKYVMQAIRQVVQSLKNRIPLIGFAGSPWTCATYMVEGGGSKHFSKIKTLVYQEPQFLHALLQRLADVTVEYLTAQIAAGVRVVMLFDTWGGILTEIDYQYFSLDYMQQIANRVQRQVGDQVIPMIFFTKGGGQWLSRLLASGCDAVGLDWTTSIKEARAQVGHRLALQGNLDPCALFAPASNIAQAVDKILTDYGSGTGHVFNLGHGILPETPPENVQILIDAVHRNVL